MKWLDQLGSGEGIPREAIRAATVNRASVAPLLIEALERHEPDSEIEENALFIAFHLLGQWREKSAYRPLARLLQWPEVETILGDATTETCHKVMANVFDGDPKPIFDIIMMPMPTNLYARACSTPWWSSSCKGNSITLKLSLSCGRRSLNFCLRINHTYGLAGSARSRC
jgi:hypothetical protein